MWLLFHIVHMQYFSIKFFFTNSSDWIEMFTYIFKFYFILYVCWDTQSENTGRWQLPNVPSAFNTYQSMFTELHIFRVWSTVWSSVNITNWHAYSELVYAYLMLRDFIFRQLISLGYLYLGKQQFYWIIIIEHHGQKQRSFFHCLLCGVLNVYMIHKMIKHIKRHISARIHFQL